VVRPHSPEWLQNFLIHLNSLRPSIQFTMEIQSDSAIPVLDVLVIRKGITLATKVYRKPTHTGQFLSFKSNHPLHVKRGLIHSLHNRASTICQEWQGLLNKISSLRCDLQVNSYSQGFIASVIDSKGSNCPNKEEKPLGSVYIPYVKDVSEKFKHTGNQYNVRTERNLQQMA
jgi:hypothetical protein